MNRDKWRIGVSVEYGSLAAAIENFEIAVKHLKDSNYARQASGNSVAQYHVYGPDPQPLRADEIEKLRKLIS